MKQQGFTLIEIAIVLLIVSIILGYTLGMVPIQQELRRYQQADEEMGQILDSVYAFAQVNGYLPCPANAASSGFQCRDDNDAPTPNDGVCEGTIAGLDVTQDSCDLWFGFVPGKTLGLNGKYSDSGLLLDPWGSPYRYQVTNDDVGGGSSIGEDFVFQGDMKNEGMSNLRPDLAVCNSLTDITTSACGANNTIVKGIPLVILSTGKDSGNVSSGVQDENLDNSDTDKVFISISRNDALGSEFDDIVKWISPNVLYSKMLETGQIQ